MSYEAATQTDINILHDFFNKCVGTGDNRMIVDVVVTDSMIKQVHVNSDRSQAKTVDRIEAKDVNYVFDDLTYRTFRIVAKNWDKTISVLKRLANPVDDETIEALMETDPAKAQRLIKQRDADTAEDPRNAVLVSPVKNHIYLQPVIMQDLGVDFHITTLDVTGENFFGDLTDGDIIGLEEHFAKAGTMLSAAFNKVKSNLVILGNVGAIKRDHILHYSTFIDFDTHNVAVSLNRFDAKLTGSDDDFGIKPTKLVIEDWFDVFADDHSRAVLHRLNTVFGAYNDYVNSKLSVKESDPEARKYLIEKLFKGAWAKVMKSSELVYTMEEQFLRPEIEEASEKLLAEVEALKGDVKLDLTSLKAFDWTNPEEPVFVKDFSEELHKAYRQEFVQLFTNSLLYSGHELLKPYGVKTVITDPADIAAVPLGAVRTEAF